MMEKIDRGTLHKIMDQAFRRPLLADSREKRY
jgi:hypothetical protein